jgi:hypothetical protein
MRIRNLLPLKNSSKTHPATHENAHMYILVNNSTITSFLLKSLEINGQC